MKKILFLVCALLITTTAFSQNILGLIGRSQDFFKLMEDQKFTEAYAYLDPSFQSKVSQDDLVKLWTKLAENLGTIKSLDMLSTKTEGEFYVVTLEGKFSKADQDFILGYNKAEKIVGLFLKPKSTAVSYIKPAYADTSLYKEKEIYIKTPGHSLVGILTSPKKGNNFPIVVLVHGSGPSDMDETIGPNKPLKDIAAGLAAKGIASIRYVKRTMLYQAEFGKSFTVKEEVLDDALAAVALARTIPTADKKQIYVLGHSLGGMLAPRIATLAPDLKGILLLAAPAVKLPDLIIEQNKYIVEASKDTTLAMKKQLDTAIMEVSKAKIFKLGTIKADSVILGLPASYWVDLNSYNQVETAKKMAAQRIFIAQGAYDFQVSAENYNIWNNALGKRKNVMLKLYPDLNHLLSSQQEKGTAKQYDTPANVSPVLINDIATWIKAK